MQRFDAYKRPVPETRTVDNVSKECTVYVLDNVWPEGNALPGLKFSSVVYVGLKSPGKDCRVLIRVPGSDKGPEELATCSWGGAGYHERFPRRKARAEVVALDDVELRVFHELQAFKG